MPSTNYWVRWDPTNKKWEFSINQGSSWSDLVENPTFEVTKFNEIAAPAVSDEGNAKLYMDNATHQLMLSENGGAYVPIKAAFEIYTADSMTVTTGGLGSGTVTTTHTLDETSVRIDEVGGSPGMDVELTINTGKIVSLSELIVHSYYSAASSGHSVAIQCYNYTTAAWVTFHTLVPATGLEYNAFTLDSNYLSSGNARMRFYHTASGNINHDLYIDYVAWRSADISAGLIYVKKTGDTMTGDLTLTSATTLKPQVSITNTNADANSASLYFAKYSASPADNDLLGLIRFYGYDDAGTPNTRNYAQIYGYAKDVSTTTEDGAIAFELITAGTLSSCLILMEGKSGSAPASFCDYTPQTTAPNIRLYAHPLGVKLRADSVAAVTITGGLSYAYIFDAVDYDASSSQLYAATCGGTANAGIYVVQTGYYRWSVIATVEVPASTDIAWYAALTTSTTVGNYLGIQVERNDATSAKYKTMSMSGTALIPAGYYIMFMTSINAAPPDNNWSTCSIERLN
jgi:hypothetical protein